MNKASPIPAAFKGKDGKYFPTLEDGRRPGDTKKTSWAHDGLTPRNIYVTLNLNPATGEPWEIHVSGNAGGQRKAFLHILGKYFTDGTAPRLGL